ncbi:hypothetical protein ACMFMG_010903 [Clarireedia jacksonii]
MAPPSPEYLAEDSSSGLLAVGIVFTILNVFFVFIRIVSQRSQGRKFSLSDLFSYVGFFFVMGQCAMGLAMPNAAGVGRHIQYVQKYEPQKLVPALKIKYAIAVLYISSFTFPKLSILHLYLDVFSASRRTRLFTYILIGVVVATWISETLTSLLQCIPIAAVWNKSIHGHCVERIKMFQYYSIPNIITDVAMMVLPIPTIWTLNMSKRIKIAVTLTFLLGSIGLICAIVRIVLFGRVNALTDPTWASVKLQEFTIIEVSMYFMAGILPTLRSFATASWVQIRSNIWSVLTGSRASASRDSLWVSSNKSSPPRTTRLHSNEIIEGTSDEHNLVEYNSQSTNGVKVEGLHNVKDTLRERDGITKTAQVTVTRQPV